MIKPIHPFLFILGLLFLTASPQPDPDPTDNGDDNHVVYKYVIEDFVHSTGLENNLLGDNSDRSAKVYLPPDYYDDTTKHFPGIYLLHGYCGDNETWYKEMAPSRAFIFIGMNIQTIMDSLIKAEAVQSLIVAAPDSYNYFSGSWFTNS